MYLNYKTKKVFAIACPGKKLAFHMEICNFFPRRAIAKTLFVFHSMYTWDTPYRVWLDLDNSLTRPNRPIFKNRYSRNSQISV